MVYAVPHSIEADDGIIHIPAEPYLVGLGGGFGDGV
jgi:hypothetical protein